MIVFGDSTHKLNIMKKQLNLRITGLADRQLRELAEKQGITMTQVIEGAIGDKYQQDADYYKTLVRSESKRMTKIIQPLQVMQDNPDQHPEYTKELEALHNIFNEYDDKLMSHPYFDQASLDDILPEWMID